MFVAALVAVSLTGMVYANWCTQVVAEHTITTGTVCVGILNVGVNDPPGTNDYVWDGSAVVQTHKDVASVTSENIGPKCTCKDKDTQYYEAVRFNVTNAYPWYVAVENVSIANCGTIPVFIDDITVNAFDDQGGIANNIWYCWTLYYPNGTAVHGRNLDRLVCLLKGIQLHPCQTIGVAFKFVFLQGIPQGAEASFEITVSATQWNEVLYPGGK